MRLSTFGKVLLIAFFSTFLSLTALTAMGQEKWVVVRSSDGAVKLVDVDGPTDGVEKLKIPSTLREEDIASMTTYSSDEEIAPEEDREYRVEDASFRRVFPNCRTLVVSQKNLDVLDGLIEPSFNAFPELEAFKVEDDPDAQQNAGLEVIDGVLFVKFLTDEEGFPAGTKFLLKYPPMHGKKRGDADSGDESPATEYVVPDSTWGVAPNAFRGCDSLKKVVLPKGLNMIGDGAFADCASLSEINFPEGLEWIESGAFWDCSSLTGEIVLPKSIHDVVSGAFSKTPVKGFVVPDDGEYLKTVDGVLFSKDIKRLICYPRGGAKEYVVPETVETIEYSAFADCVALEKVALPKGLKKISPWAFASCEALSGELALPDGVTEIGECAFVNCVALEKVAAPKGLKKIGPWAFAACEALSGELALPDGVTEIGEGAFVNCSALSVVSVPANATIAPNAFKGTKVEEPVRRPVER